MEKAAKQGAAGSKPLTTFVHTDTNAFREIVQRLTGPSETTVAQDGEPTKVAGVKRTTSKLHERRQYMRPKLEIVKPSFYPKSGSSSRNSSFPPSPMSGNSSRLPSPTTPSTIFSQLSIQDEEKLKESPILVQLNKEEEEKAIKERRFYLHPSPRSKPAGYTEPELLPLFPLASPTSEKV
ncbi:hypothetical protein L6164_014959 [Bauhinia variegata]|uniref:Uncharacterized protein n=1 Tax=Bauhinia variegata TaxID=167791 RepID=A0ACB9NJ59_BAUVA|nr:hypothetical protein L6164_014959 [Bauhinia variegata]